MRTHKIKMGDGKLHDVEITRGKAIRYFCYECMGWQKAEVRRCTAPNCPLFPFRPLRTDAENAQAAPKTPQEPTI